MGCTPDELLVLSIYRSRKIGVMSEKDLVERPESKSEVWRLEVGEHRVRGSGCRRVGDDLDKRRLRVSLLH
jgi:hypothetical protein